jgi:translocation protein SEC66
MDADKVVEPYFPRHRERDIYVSLLQKTDPPTPEHLLKAALVRRAVTNVSRIMRLREDKPALQNLLQKGSIGDDLWNSLLAAEKELEAEILETAAEANTFVEGWGQIIFQTATEVLHAEKMRSIVEQIVVVRAEKGELPSFCRSFRRLMCNLLEQKYGIKVKPITLPANMSAIPRTSLVAPGSPVPAVSPISPASSSSTEGPAVTSPTGTESVASSDGEAEGLTSPRTPKVSNRG